MVLDPLMLMCRHCNVTVAKRGRKMLPLVTDDSWKGDFLTESILYTIKMTLAILLPDQLPNIRRLGTDTVENQCSV